jgi:AraC-like DNA-binding protein
VRLENSIRFSRTRLAERFRHFPGVPPMSYLAQWRLQLGADILKSTEDSIAEVAAVVGYGSEGAFNRAFRGQFDRLSASATFP